MYVFDNDCSLFAVLVYKNQKLYSFVKRIDKLSNFFYIIFIIST